MNYDKILVLILLKLIVLVSVKGHYTSGYFKEIAGKTIRYECQQPVAYSSLLVRSLCGKKYIEWFIAPIPDDVIGTHEEFIFIAGIEINAKNNNP